MKEITNPLQGHLNIAISSFWGRVFLNCLSSLLPDSKKDFSQQEDYFHYQREWGTFSGAQLPSGVSMGSMELSSQQGGVDFLFTAEDQEVPYKLGFCLKGPLYLKYPSFNKEIKIESNQSFLVSPEAGSRMTILPRQEVSLVFLFLSQRCMTSYLKQMQNRNALVKDLSEETTVFFKTPISLDLERCLRKIQSFQNRDGLEQIKVQAIVLDLLTRYFLPHQIEPSQDFYLQKVYEIEGFLEDHMKDPLTVLDIARTFGWNPQKVQASFKEVYGKTLMAQFRKIRMNHARKLIRQEGYLVKEAAAAVGYSNISHFIQAFKEEFGLSPGILKKKIL